MTGDGGIVGQRIVECEKPGTVVTDFSFIGPPFVVSSAVLYIFFMYFPIIPTTCTRWKTSDTVYLVWEGGKSSLWLRRMTSVRSYYACSYLNMRTTITSQRRGEEILKWESQTNLLWIFTAHRAHSIHMHTYLCVLHIKIPNLTAWFTASHSIQ